MLFVNPQGKRLDLGEWTRVTPADRLGDVIGLLWRNKRARVEFVPTWNADVMQKELAALIDCIMVRDWPVNAPLLVVFDEFDLYAWEGSRATPCHQVAQRGGKAQVWGWFITQHPSIVSKTIVRQCTKKTIFMLEDSAAYLTRHSMPGEQIEQILSRAAKYSYLVWAARELKGPYRD